MSVKKPGRVWLRTWKTKKGSVQSAWAVDYYVPDPLTGRLAPHRKHFQSEAEALAWSARTFVDVEAGAHVPDSRSCTTDAYEQHLRLQINPRIGPLKLTELTLPRVCAFEDALRKDVSASMTKRVMASLRSLLATAQVRGLVARNVGRDLPRNRGSGRDTAPLRIGVDIPALEEVRTILHRHGPLASTNHCGGLQWPAVQ